LILFLHNQYRVAGGEERAVEDLLWLAREHLGEEAELLARDSATLGRSRAAVALVNDARSTSPSSRTTSR